MTELVVTLVIIGLLAAFAIPRFVNLLDFQEVGFYDEALSAARYAQKFAISSGCDVQLSVAGGVYTLNQRATSCTSGAFTRAVVDPGTLQAPFTGTSPADVTFTMTASPVVFDALGRTTDGVTRTVTVGSRSFQIIGATGYAQTP
jgi:MSHA pilin protein MshC